ncbi:MAG: Stp1/IreP family PP2C-type Ser/Thr phosphatase [Desulfuromonadales bacterium]|nr:Stp1/IreP family PP2C-type Ser/Thr phosphatase [Desulfuromonadales bacterium]
MQIIIKGVTHVGMVRPHNEDALFFDQNRGLCVVADGMGGQLAGEVASRMAIDLVKETVAGGTDEGLVENSEDEFLPLSVRRLASGIRLANQQIYRAGNESPEWRNMGTTIVAGLLNEAVFHIAHVGDSRCYLLRGGTICQLTDDHSLVAEQLRQGLMSQEEAEQSRLKNIITRALGAEPEVRIDISEVDTMAGDRFLLCSDGLTNMLTDEEILAIVQQETDADRACETLVGRANERGGKDNITVVLLALD